MPPLPPPPGVRTHWVVVEVLEALLTLPVHMAPLSDRGRGRGACYCNRAAEASDPESQSSVRPGPQPFPLVIVVGGGGGGQGSQPVTQSAARVGGRMTKGRQSRDETPSGYSQKSGRFQSARGRTIRGRTIDFGPTHGGTAVGPLPFDALPGRPPPPLQGMLARGASSTLQCEPAAIPVSTGTRTVVVFFACSRVCCGVLRGYCPNPMFMTL